MGYEETKEKIFAGIAIVAIVAIGFWFIIREPVERGQIPKEKAAATYEGLRGEFFVEIPSGWYPHEISGNAVVFTPSPAFSLPEGTESYTIGRQVSIRKASFAEVIGAKTFEDWLEKNCFFSSCEFFQNRVDRTTASGIRLAGARTVAGIADGDVLMYAFDAGAGVVWVLSHYPYVPGSADAAAFEALVDSFRIPKIRIVTDASEPFRKLGGSASPAAGVCDESGETIIVVSVNEDVPNPRCVRVRPEQTLRVVNGASKNVELWFGDAEVDSRLYGQAQPGEAFTFLYPLGEFLKPGVHRLRVRPFAGPEIWLVEL